MAGQVRTIVGLNEDNVWAVRGAGQRHRGREEREPGSHELDMLAIDIILNLVAVKATILKSYSCSKFTSCVTRSRSIPSHELFILHSAKYKSDFSTFY